MSPGARSLVGGAGARSSAGDADIERPRPEHNANSDPTNLEHGSAKLGRYFPFTGSLWAQKCHSATGRTVAVAAIPNSGRGADDPRLVRHDDVPVAFVVRVPVPEVDRRVAFELLVERVHVRVVHGAERLREFVLAV